MKFCPIQRFLLEKIDTTLIFELFLSLDKRILQKDLRVLIWVGILSFTIFYGIAAAKYPGGSQADSSSVGFDWIHNYWCNLLSHEAVNGQINTGRPYAIGGMMMLCASLASFFYIFPSYYPSNWDKTIKVSGLYSMLSAFFIFTKWHDEITIISSIFGLITLIGIFVALHKNKAQKAIKFALIVGVLLLMNNYIYYTKHFIEALPLLQKVSFLFVLLWIIGITLTFKNDSKPSLSKH